jgi:A/G-specific adenine glycosylase
MTKESHPREVAQALEEWFAERKRDLPWREAGDPYRTWVAEVMLQQTRVETAAEYYHDFLDRFPTVEALAEADEEAVLEAWAGLGYYNRARWLHSAAQQVVDDHRGTLPRTAEALQELPGIGPYTAGAVASIAFGEPEPALDTNAKRVLARLTLEEGTVDRGAVEDRLREVSRSILREGEPGDLNQAIMELGSLVCQPGRPRCEECPVAEHCRARAAGRQLEVPEREDGPEVVPVAVAAAILRRGEEILQVRAPEDGMLAGTWGFPWAEVQEEGDPTGTARGLLAERGIEAEVRGRHESFTYTFSHRKWTVHPVRLSWEEGPLGQGERWVDPAGLDPDTLPGVQRRILEAAGTALQRRLPGD